MVGLKLTVVSPERELYSGEVDIVLAPGVEGRLGILPHYAPLITQLEEGELCTRVGEEEYFFAIHGGFMHVLPDEVIVLADVAERAGEIDEARAEAACQRAGDAEQGAARGTAVDRACTAALPGAAQGGEPPPPRVAISGSGRERVVEPVEKEIGCLENN